MYGKPQRNVKKLHTLCENLMREPQKVIIFSHLELKKRRFWSVLGLRTMVLAKTLSLGRKGT